MIILNFAFALAFFIFLVWYLASSEQRIRRWTGLASIVSILVTCLLSLYPLDRTVKLGLDLKGGTSFLLELQGTPSPSAIDQAISVIRKRVDAFGLSEPIIQPVGNNRINVQIPGLTEKDKASARTQLSKVAKLEFRLVNADNDALLEKFRATGERPPLDYDILNLIDRDKDGKEIKIPIVVKRRGEMSGSDVTRAYHTFDNLGRPEVVIQFNDEGRQLFGELTAANVHQRLAIVLDNEVRSAPEIKGAIYEGNATISGGNMTQMEADELASVLENPLESPVSIVEERGVDPSLGQDSINSGKAAGLYAFFGVVAFMVIYYRFAGVIAVGALVVNLVILLGLLAQLHFTLTLPGIAGIVLTIGMAVDANVLIYERMRDEILLGKPLRNAIEAGFDRAFSAIFDSNITTLIPAVILIFLGSGPLQGFAVTLTLGIVANLFAALVVSRNAFEWLLTFNQIRRLDMMRFLQNPRFDFLKLRGLGLGLSLIILATGAISFQKRGADHMLGVDFTGGDAVTLHYQNRVEVGAIRQVLAESGVRESLIQYANNDDKLLIQTKQGEGDVVAQILEDKFPTAGFAPAGRDSVGALVGKELAERAIYALALGLFGILIYSAIRFEWSYAVAAAIGQLHDVLIALSVMAILGRELTLPLVGAFLTIAGYSINDKIVVFDRIREGVRLREKGIFYDTINRSLNLTLARTLLTGGTTLIATSALIYFGGAVIHDFAVAMFIGIVSGIYSSHFISPPIAFWLSERKDKTRAARLRAAAPAVV